MGFLRLSDLTPKQLTEKPEHRYSTMATADIVGVRIVGRFQDQNIVSTLHYRIAAQTVSEHLILDSLVNAASAALTSLILARCVAAFQLIGYRGFSLTGENKRPGILSVGTAGDITGDSAAAFIGRTITLYTDSTNYRRRGRFMLSGGSPTMFDQADGAVTGTEITALSSLASALLDPLIDADSNFVPVLPPSGALPVEDLTSSLPRKTPSVIRSRRIAGMLIG